VDSNWLFNPATLQFCEQTLSGLVKHPADTWTNIGPCLAGMAILRFAKRPLEILLGISVLWTGIASAYFHASNTILGESLDLSGMFLFILTLAAFQQKRATPETNTKLVFSVVILGSLFLTSLSVYSSLFASPLFGLLVLLVALRGFYQRKTDRWLWRMLFTFALAWIFWWLDFLHIVCIPENHLLTGHGMWHLLNGLVFWFAFLHYSASKEHTT
jgi:hypothetical protein